MSDEARIFDIAEWRDRRRPAASRTREAPVCPLCGGAVEEGEVMAAQSAPMFWACSPRQARPAAGGGLEDLSSLEPLTPRVVRGTRALPAARCTRCNVMFVGYAGG